MPVLALKSSDEMIFEVDVEVAKHSKMIKQMLESLGDKDDGPLLLPCIEGAVLEKVIEWCTNEENKPEKKRFHYDFNYRSVVDEWTFQFFQVEKKMVFLLLNAANFLNIDSLMGWASFTIWEMMEGKTAEEIRKEFNMPNDITAEELAEIENSDKI